MIRDDDYPKLNKDRQINRALLDGDQGGREALANRYFEEIKQSIKKRKNFWDLVNRGVFNTMDADDIAMRIYDVFERKVQGEWIRINLENYYHRLVFRVIQGYYKIVNRRSLREPLVLNDYRITDNGDVIRMDPPDKTEKKELDIYDKVSIILFTYFKDMKPKYFMVVCLRYYEHMKVQEIADLFGYSKGRISQIIKKEFCLKALYRLKRSKLTEEEIFDNGLQALLKFGS